jgi:tRNA-2-methylthio-N6-dimethylallyladenosine synthase
MNVHDSEKIEGILEGLNYFKTDTIKNADLVIINTCCVRENAELKVYGQLGKLKVLKTERPDLLIGICGCMMQQQDVVDNIFKKYPHVDFIFGTHNLHDLPKILDKAIECKETYIDIWEKEGEIIERIPTKRAPGIKAWVNIMYGCNNFCTYCIVPYVRGRERSRDPKDIVGEINHLVKGGYKEITLLGQNVNSYGKDLNDKFTFPELLAKIDKETEISRVRFMTSHPKDLTDELIEAMAKYPSLCEHIHLPVQSGSNEILKKMNRMYNREHYFGLVKKLKDAIPNIAITTDIIVGFPGESEDHFYETLDLVERCAFDTAFTFKYSIRKGTPAEKMGNQISEEIKSKRLDNLMVKLNEISKIKNLEMEGQIVEVLVEGQSKNKIQNLTGRTRTFKLINFEGTKDIIGKIIKVKVTEAKTWSLEGIIINE